MILANVAAAETLRARARAADLSRARRAVAGEARGAARIPARRSTSRCRRAARCGRTQFNRILARVKGRDVEKLVNEVVLRTQAQAEYSAGELRPFRPQPAPLRAFHLADPPLCRPRRASRADPRAEARRRRACPKPRTPRALAEIAAQHLGRRAPRHEGRARDRRPADRAFPRRPHRRDLRGPHLRRHPRRPVRQARRDRRRRLHPGAHHRRRIFPLRRGEHAHDRRPQRRDVPARRPRHGRAGRGGAGRRRAALRASVRRPRHDAARSAGRPTGRGTARRSAAAKSRSGARSRIEESADDRSPPDRCSGSRTDAISRPSERHAAAMPRR